MIMAVLSESGVKAKITLLQALGKMTDAGALMRICHYIYQIFVFKFALMLPASSLFLSNEMRFGRFLSRDDTST